MIHHSLLVHKLDCLVGTLISKLHLFMHFFVHGLDMRYTLPRPLYGQASSKLNICLELRFYLVFHLDDHAFALYIDVRSSRPDNFLVLGFSAFL